MARKINTLALMPPLFPFGIGLSFAPSRDALRFWNRCVMLALCFIVMGTPAILGQTNLPAPFRRAGPDAPNGSPASAAQDKAAAEAEAKAPAPVSIFFTPEQQEQIRGALDAYEQSKNVTINKAESKANDFLNQITEPEPKKEAPPEETSFTYPQFFLNSLVYHAKSDWVVLINNQRFTNNELESAELRIVDVDDERVVIEWKPKKMERVDESLVSDKNDNIKVDKFNQTVTFKLYSNQTFSSYVMRILEGKVHPVTVNLKQGNGDNDTATNTDNVEDSSKKSDNKKIENTVVDDIKNDVGIKGLNKTYKKMGLEQ